MLHPDTVAMTSDQSQGYACGTRRAWLAMCIALVGVLVAWGASFYTFQEGVTNVALTMAMAMRDQVHSNLQFSLLDGLNIGANMVAADFGGLIDCGATSLGHQLSLAQHASIQLHTFEKVRLLAVLAPVAGTSSISLVLVGNAQLGTINISQSQVYVGDSATDTLTAFPLLADGRIDREHSKLVLATGLDTWMEEMYVARGWRASLTEEGWQRGDLMADEASGVIQPLHQSVFLVTSLAHRPHSVYGDR